MYIVLANEGKKRSIEIVPLPPGNVSITEPPVTLGDGVASTLSSTSSQKSVVSNDAYPCCQLISKAKTCSKQKARSAAGNGSGATG